MAAIRAAPAMYICLLSFVQRHVLLLLLDVLVGRSNDTTAFEVQLLDAVSRPTYDTGHGENRCVNFLWQAEHLIDEATVEVKICADRFV